MDIASLVGMFGVTALILLSMKLAGQLGMFWDLTSLVIVLGGSAFATLMRWPVSKFIGGMLAVTQAIKNQNAIPEDLISEISELAATARKNSILGLEKVEVKDEFLQKGVKYLVDGYSEEAIEQILGLEITNTAQRCRDGKMIFEHMGEACPAYGMIGTVIGLIVIMANLNDPNAIGPGLAVALVTTLYGSLIANAFFIPMASKIDFRGKERVQNMRIVLEGVKTIINGDNPRLIQEKLETFLDEVKEG